MSKSTDLRRQNDAVSPYRCLGEPRRCLEHPQTKNTGECEVQPAGQPFYISSLSKVAHVPPFLIEPEYRSFNNDSYAGGLNQPFYPDGFYDIASQLQFIPGLGHVFPNNALDELGEFSQPSYGDFPDDGASRVLWPFIPPAGLRQDFLNSDIGGLVDLNQLLGAGAIYGNSSQVAPVLQDVVNGDIDGLSSPSQDLGTDAPDLDGDATRGSRGSGESQDLRCKKNCAGNLIGTHKCFRHGKSLIISCLGNNHCQSTFKTKNDFNRHWKDVHLHARVGVQTLLDCPVANCRRVGENGFKRPDNLRQHRRLCHGEDIPKVRIRFERGSNRVRVARSRQSSGASSVNEIVGE